MRLTLSALLIAGSLSACGGVEPPEGLLCSGEPQIVHDASELSSALAGAMPGACVIMAGGSYAGSFDVPAGITLAGARDADAIIVGPGATQNAITVAASAVSLVGFSVAGESRSGVRISAGGITLRDMAISGGRRAGVEIRCEEQGCLMPSERTLLADVHLSGSQSGLMAARANVRLEGGSIRDHGSESLSGGAGAYLFDGAQIEISRTQIADNAYGVVIDGAATRGLLEDVVIERNDDVGLWAQGLRGTMAAPALVITGAASSLRGNGLTGLGAFDAQGIAVTGGEIADTVLKNVSIDLMNNADIGDGVGLFAGSAEILIAGVSLHDNARAQAIVDDPGPGVTFGAGLVGGGMFLVVVQNDAGATVTVPPGVRSMVASPLPIRAVPLPVPSP